MLGRSRRRLFRSCSPTRRRRKTRKRRLRRGGTRAHGTSLPSTPCLFRGLTTGTHRAPEPEPEPADHASLDSIMDSEEEEEEEVLSIVVRGDA
jgi:hypothetical protein